MKSLLSDTYRQNFAGRAMFCRNGENPPGKMLQNRQGSRCHLLRRGKKTNSAGKSCGVCSYLPILEVYSMACKEAKQVVSPLSETSD